MQSHNKTILILLLTLTLSACGTARKVSNLVSPPTPTIGTFKVGNPYKILGKWYTPKESYTHSETGIASWYGPTFHEKLTANGETYDQNTLTAAHRTLQMPSIVRVTNLENGRSIIVRINDRGPFARGRIIDMSSRGAELLQFKNKGTAKVKVQVLAKESRAVAEAAKRGQDINGVEIALNEGKSIEEALGQTFSYNDDYDPTPIADIAQAPTQPTAGLSPIESQILPPQAQQTLAQEHSFVKHTPVPTTNIYVQAGAFSSADNAAAQAASLSRAGQNAQVYPTTINGQTFHRVRIGPVTSVDNADQVLANLAANGQNDAIIIVE